jgi:hypothetical protein
MENFGLAADPIQPVTSIPWLNPPTQALDLGHWLGLESGPDLARGVRYELELGPLLILGEEIPFCGGSKAALRADREIFQRNEARGFINAAREVVRRFQAWQFRADQSEHDGLSFWDESQCLERARAVVVVFEQEAINFKCAEQFFGDRVVAAFRIPLAAIIATAEMDRERNAVAARRAETRIVGFDGVVEGGIGIDFHFGADPFAPL